MKAALNALCLATIGVAIVVAFFVAIGLFQIVAYGNDITLFAMPDEPVCLFHADEPVCLFAADEPVCLFRPVPEADPGSFTACLLFPVVTEEKTPPAPVDFSRNQTDKTSIASCVRVDATNVAKNEDTLKRELQRDERPLLICYCPKWCTPCGKMIDAVGNGDHRVNVVIVKGEPENFPHFVQQYAKDAAWPVLHWTAPSGKGALNFGVKSLDELAAIVKTEPKEAGSIVRK